MAVAVLPVKSLRQEMELLPQALTVAQAPPSRTHLRKQCLQIR